jgi:hypothetical protein
MKFIRAHNLILVVLTAAAIAPATAQDATTLGPASDFAALEMQMTAANGKW